MKKSLKTLTVVSVLMSSLSAPQAQAYFGQGLVDSCYNAASSFKNGITSTPGAHLIKYGAQNITSSVSNLATGGYSMLHTMSQVSLMGHFFGAASVIGVIAGIYAGAFQSPVVIQTLGQLIPSAVQQITQMYQSENYVGLAALTYAACGNAHKLLMVINAIQSTAKSAFYVTKGVAKGVLGAAELAIGLPTFAVCGTTKLVFNTTALAYNTTAYTLDVTQKGLNHLAMIEDDLEENEEDETSDTDSAYGDDEVDDLTDQFAKMRISS